MTHLKSAMSVGISIMLATAPAGAEDAAPGAADAPVDATAGHESYSRQRDAQIENAKWSVTVDVQMVSLPQADGLAMLPALRSLESSAVEAAVADVQEKIRAGTAKLRGWPMVATLDRVRAVSETIVEARYPTEFSPPAGPTDRSVPVEREPSKESPLLPNAFETRNVGATLEVEPRVLDEGGRIVLNMVPQRVDLLGFKTFETGHTPDGTIGVTGQPEFTTSKVNAEVSVANGRHQLIAVHLLASGELELFIVHAAAVRVKGR